MEAFSICDTYHEHRCLVRLPAFILNGTILAILNLVQFHIDLAGGRQAEKCILNAKNMDQTTNSNEKIDGISFQLKFSQI